MTMKEYHDASGRLSITLADNDREFSVFASRLENRSKAKCIHKLDGLDQRYWDFDVGGTTVVLHSDVFAGVSVHVEDGTNDDLLRRIAASISDVQSNAFPNGQQKSTK